MISDCISTVMDLAHRLDMALGNTQHSNQHNSSGEYGVSSYVDAYMAEDSVFDMEEIDVQVGFEEGGVGYDSDGQDISPKEGGSSSKSSCYHSASPDANSWTTNTARDDYALISPLLAERSAFVGPGKVLEQLDMKPMNDFRDYVNFTPTASAGASFGN